MRLHFLSKLCDEPLGRFRQKLGERERCDSLNHRGQQHHRNQLPQQFNVVFGDDTIDQEFGGVGKHQPRNPVHDHQQEAQR